MTTEPMADAASDEFSEERQAEFFSKGERLFSRHVQPLIEQAGASRADVVVDYGCGMGRILRAVHAAGYRCSGVDISPTMLEHCRRLTPALQDLFLLDSHGRSQLPSGSAAVVYSFAVVQHIAALSAYERAFDEMCRALHKGGVLGVQVNCEDFVGGDFEKPDRTENFETYSLHYRSGESKPYMRHDQDNWSGVYIGSERLDQMLPERGVRVLKRYYHTPKKLRAVWFVGVKD